MMIFLCHPGEDEISYLDEEYQKPFNHRSLIEAYKAYIDKKWKLR